MSFGEHFPVRRGGSLDRVWGLLNRAVVGFYEKWAEKAATDPGWAEENPVRITVCKSGGAGLDVRLEPVL